MEERLIIVGAGLAGLSAAITAAQKGMKNVLVSLQPSERAQSVLAEGGISGELSGSAEGLEQHFQDTMKAGGYLADPEGVRRLVNAAPEVICGLRQLGTAFQMENGKLVCRRMGGHSRERTVFVKDQTGKAIMSALIDEARKYENEKTVLRMPHHDFLELMIQGDLCGGCVVKDRYTGEIRRLKGPVILASGGLSGLFPGCATGTVHNTGIVTAAAFRQGVELANLEFIQYHPTTFQIPGKRCLVSESARSEGGRLMARRNQSKWYFMEDIYGADGNLASRDVISREMEKIYRRPDCDHQIWMDMTAVPSEAWRSKLSGMRRECMDYLQIDPMKNPVPVEPGVHYFMGGILTDIYHRTSKRFLYAAGECACQYHGANRLGGNSMLGAVAVHCFPVSSVRLLPGDLHQLCGRDRFLRHVSAGSGCPDMWGAAGLRGRTYAGKLPDTHF